VTFALSILSASAAHAQVTRLEIASREPFKGSQAVGEGGPYEIIRGKVHGEVDPADPRNRIIQDLELAPRNTRGRVEYVATFALAKPVDPARASGTLVYQSSIAVTAPQRRARTGTSRSSAAGKGTLRRPRQTRLSPSPSRGIAMDRPSPGRSSRASTTWRPARTPSLFV
jgi:hypothetical protein